MTSQLDEKTIQCGMVAIGLIKLLTVYRSKVLFTITQPTWDASSRSRIHYSGRTTDLLSINPLFHSHSNNVTTQQKSAYFPHNRKIKDQTRAYPRCGGESHTAPCPQTPSNATQEASERPSATSYRCIAVYQPSSSLLHATPVGFYPDYNSSSSHTRAARRTNSARRGRSYIPLPLRLYISTQYSVSRHTAVFTALSVRKTTGRMTTDRSCAQREGSARCSWA